MVVKLRNFNIILSKLYRNSYYFRVNSINNEYSYFNSPYYSMLVSIEKDLNTCYVDVRNIALGSDSCFFEVELGSSNCIFPLDKCKLSRCRLSGGMTLGSIKDCITSKSIDGFTMELNLDTDFVLKRSALYSIDFILNDDNTLSYNGAVAIDDNSFTKYSNDVPYTFLESIINSLKIKTINNYASYDLGIFTGLDLNSKIVE